MTWTRQRLSVALLAAVLAIVGYLLWQHLNGDGLPAGFASGNGRIEAAGE